jgi:hypothetical protein
MIMHELTLITTWFAVGAGIFQEMLHISSRVAGTSVAGSVMENVIVRRRMRAVTGSSA